MQHYKFYFLKKDGHIFRAEDHLLPDDQAALDVASQLSAEHASKSGNPPAWCSAML